MQSSSSPPPQVHRSPAIHPVVFHFISPEMPSLFENNEIPRLFIRIMEGGEVMKPRQEQTLGRYHVTILTGAEQLVKQHITSTAQAGIGHILNRLIKMIRGQEKQIDQTAKDPSKTPTETSGKDSGITSGKVLLGLKVFESGKGEAPELQKQLIKTSRENAEPKSLLHPEKKGEEGSSKLPITVDFKKMDSEKGIAAPAINIKKSPEEGPRSDGQKIIAKEQVLLGAAKTSEFNQKHMPQLERNITPMERSLPRQGILAVKPPIEPPVAIPRSEREKVPHTEQKLRDDSNVEKVTRPEPASKPQEIPREVRHVEHVRVEQQHVRPEHQANRTIPRVENETIVPAWIGINIPGFAKEAIEDFEKRSASYSLGEEADHKLVDLLFMLTCAVICGAKTIPEIVNFIENREKWFKAILGMRHGLPSRRLIWTLIAGIDPQQFQKTVVKWLHYIGGSNRNSHAASYLSSIHIWETPLGVMFGQKDTGDASVDLQAVPDLLDAFFMSGSMIMTHRVDPKANSAKKIVERSGEYLFEVSEELDPSWQQARKMIEGSAPPDIKAHESYIEGQERLIAVVLNNETGLVEQQWGAKAKTMSKLIYQPFMLSSTASVERFFVSSLMEPTEDMFDMVRVQRRAESKSEWLLQLAFAPVSHDDLMDRIRLNLSYFESFGINLIAQSSDFDGNLVAARKRAGTDADFLLQLFN